MTEPTPTITACPACGGGDLRPFHTQDGVPEPQRADARLPGGGARLPEGVAAHRLLPGVRLRHQHGLRRVAQRLLDELRGEPGVLAPVQRVRRGAGPALDRHLRHPRQERARDRLRQGLVPRADVQAGRQHRHRRRPQRPLRPAREPRPHHARAGPVHREAQRPAGRRGHLPPHARAHPPRARVHDDRAGRHRRPPRHDRALRAARRAARARRPGLLGRLLRALLVLQRRFAGPPVPADRVRGARRAPRVRRPVPHDRRPPLDRAGARRAAADRGRHGPADRLGRPLRHRAAPAARRLALPAARHPAPAAARRWCGAAGPRASPTSTRCRWATPSPPWSTSTRSCRASSSPAPASRSCRPSGSPSCGPTTCSS